MWKRISRIVKRKDGFHVLSEEGKNLGGPYDSKDEAVKRLRQVEYFKHHKGALIDDALLQSAKTPVTKCRHCQEPIHPTESGWENDRNIMDEQWRSLKKWCAGNEDGHEPD